MRRPSTTPISNKPTTNSTRPQQNTGSIQKPLGTKTVKQISLPEDLNNNKLLFSSPFETSSFPPYSTTKLEIKETTNSNPYLLKSSLYRIPANKTIFNEVKLPIGLVVHPFHPEIYPTIQNRKEGVRCGECSSFINKFTKIDEFRRTFECNICNTQNPIDDLGVLSDIEPTMIYDIDESTNNRSRPSEMVDDSYFKINKLKESNLLIMLENTSNNVLFDSFIKSLNMLEELYSSENKKEKVHRITLILYNEDMEILTINKRGKISVKNICNSPFIPPSLSIPFQRFIQNIPLITQYLENRERVSRNIDIQKVLKLSIDISKNFYGTHNLLICSQSSTISNELHTEYIDLYILNNSTLNIVEYKKKVENPLSRFVVETNGTLLSITDLESMDIYNTLYKLIGGSVYWGIRLDVKTSNSLSKSRVYVNTQIRSAISTPISSFNNSSCATISLTLSEPMKHQERCYTQVLTTYYTSDIERKCLVMNLELVASENLEDIYDHIMYDSLLNVFLRYITDDLSNMKSKSLNVQRMAIDSLRCYKVVKNKLQSRGSTLLVPSSMKSFFVLLNVYQKNPIFKEGQFFKLRELVSKPLDCLVYSLYPRLVSFSDYVLNSSDQIDTENIDVEYLQLRYRTLEMDDIYLLDDQACIYIYIPPQVDIQLVESIITESGDINTDTEEGILMSQLLEFLMGDSEKEVRVVDMSTTNNSNINKEGEKEFLTRMYEDKLNGICELSEFLRILHVGVEKVD